MGHVRPSAKGRRVCTSLPAMPTPHGHIRSIRHPTGARASPPTTRRQVLSGRVTRLRTHVSTPDETLQQIQLAPCVNPSTERRARWTGRAARACETRAVLGDRDVRRWPSPQSARNVETDSVPPGTTPSPGARDRRAVSLGRHLPVPTRRTLPLLDKAIIGCRDDEVAENPRPRCHVGSITATRSSPTTTPAYPTDQPGESGRQVTRLSVAAVDWQPRVPNGAGRAAAAIRASPPDRWFQESPTGRSRCPNRLGGTIR